MCSNNGYKFEFDIQIRIVTLIHIQNYSKLYKHVLINPGLPDPEKISKHFQKGQIHKKVKQA